MSFEVTVPVIQTYSPDWNLDHIFNPQQKSKLIEERILRQKSAESILTEGDPRKLGSRVSQWSETSIVSHPRIPLDTYPVDSYKVEGLAGSSSSQTVTSVKKFLSSNVLKQVDFVHFRQAFESCLFNTLQFILSLPPEDQGYIIVVDEVEKSNSWMVGLAFKMIAGHPPIDVVHREDLSKAIQRKEVRHVLLLDDASYSGKQIVSTLDVNLFANVDGLRNIRGIHLVIPYMTNQAREKISTAVSSFNEKEANDPKSYFISSAVTMPTIEELSNSNSDIHPEDCKEFCVFLEKHYKFTEKEAKALTLTYFDHKIADKLSTPDILIRAVVGNIIPPYKSEYDDVLNSYAVLSNPAVRVDLVPKVGQELQEQFVIVQKNGKTYVCTKIDCEGLVIDRKGEKIPLKPLEMLELTSEDQLLHPLANLLYKDEKIAVL